MRAMTGELILIVEDNPRNLKLARDLLQLAGFRTLEAGTAGEGVALVRERRPDLVLMDIQLPDADGVSALRRIRADPESASVPVLAVTAFAMKGDRERLLSVGFDGYLAKPIDVKVFASQVRDHLPTPRRPEIP
jgi:two-component system, cell cycle response regulator DivK